MLYDPARHEPLRALAWDEARARAAIADIVRDTEERFSSTEFWPLHPRDADEGDTAPATPLYHGAAGVVWALHYLQAAGACALRCDYAPHLPTLRERNARWLESFGGAAFAASYLMGDTGLSLLEYALAPQPAVADRLAELIESNLDCPTRELMWGSPGTLLAALFLHAHTGDARFASLFRTTADELRAQLLQSPEFGCAYWTQDMYGETTSYLDAVHGFVATASPLLRGRHLLDASVAAFWETTIANTIRASATRDGELVNWRAFLYDRPGMPRLMQFCHGAPGFVVCLADMPGAALDDLLLRAGEATWAAGPLVKGSNLCHGTGGNGYAFLKLHGRTGDSRWLARARAFAMHGIAQTEEEHARVGQMRYSLWTGDPGFAIYLWDCIHATARFPTLDAFFLAGR